MKRKTIAERMNDYREYISKMPLPCLKDEWEKARKILIFMAALQDIYKDEDDRESWNLHIKFQEDNLTEDFTAMFYAMYMLYTRLTGDDEDVFGFTHLCNRLVFQKLLENREAEWKREMAKNEN